MKKFLLSSFSFLLFAFSGASAYTSTDVQNATFLADQNIIVKQSVDSKYRLDDTITRAEVVGMALKIQGTTLPENYVCKNYFSDVKYDVKNNWKCRAVETAADKGLVTRSNTKFRPQDQITRAEALLILAKAAGIYEKIKQSELPYQFDSNVEWQNELLRGSFGMNLFSIEDYEYDVKTSTFQFSSVPTIYTIHFHPDRSATRAEVFGFAKNIIEHTNSGIFCELEGVKVEGACQVVSSDMGGRKTIKFGDHIENDMSGYAGPECSIVYFGESIQNDTTFFGASSYLQINTGLGKIDAIGTSYVGPGVLILGQKGYYILGGSLGKCAPHVTLSDVRKVMHSDVLMLYYKNISQGSVELAYIMRSPTGVSLETFQSWYKNVTNVTFREDTLKDLGDNTYEFLVDMTENGVKSTYKVKSKVDLENFTIDNISSVKQ